MAKATLLVGIRHSLPHLKGLIRFLDSEGLNNQRVMLELTKNPVPSQPLDGFFRLLEKHVIKKGGIVVYGDDEEILERTYAKKKELGRKMSTPGLSTAEWAELYCQSRYDVPHDERDPHFLSVVLAQNPNLLVLGRDHIPFLLEKHYKNKPHRVVYIPKD